MSTLIAWAIAGLSTALAAASLYSARHWMRRAQAAEKERDRIAGEAVQAIQTCTGALRTAQQILEDATAPDLAQLTDGQTPC